MRITAALLTVVALVPVAAHAARPQRVAVYPLKPLGLDAETVGRLEDILRSEIRRVPSVREVKKARVERAIAGRHGQKPLSCDGKPDCLAELGRRAHVDLVVFGVVAGLGDAYTINLKAVKTGSGKVLRQVSVSVGGKREVLIDGIRGAAYQLLRPDLYTGRLELKTPVAGAQVQIDGKTVGTTPLARPVAGLSPGRHALKIVKTGFSDFDKFVEVRFQRTTIVTVDLAGSTVSGVIYQEVPAPPLVANEGSDAGAGKNGAGKNGATKNGAGKNGAGKGGALASNDHDADDTGAPPLVPIVPPSHAAPSGHGLRWTGVGLLGAGVVSAGVGGFFGVQAKGLESTLNKRFAANGGPLPSDATDWQAMRSDQTVANVLFVAGGVLAAAGGVAVLLDLGSGSGGDGGSVALLPFGPGGAGLTLRVTR